MTHSAAWINGESGNLVIDSAQTSDPGPGELLVKVECIAFSPVEAKHQRMEIHPLEFPNILGLSFSGTVQAVGHGVDGFARGDPVAVVRPHSKINDARFGSFQQYALAVAAATTKLPSSELLVAGASAILNLGTVTSACSFFLGMDRPNLEGRAAPKDETILIYGGSSSCAGLAISYATAAGYKVVTTSSPQNYHYVSTLGAVAVIDHAQPARKIVQDLEKHGPYHGILDTIGVPEVTSIMVRYLSLIGGGTYFTLLPPTKPIPDNINCIFKSYLSVFEDPQNEQFREWFYNTLVPKGLSSGMIVPTPTQWVTGGLRTVQRALDLMDCGLVSAHKLVMDPWRA